MNGFIPRHIASALLHRLSQYPVVAITGPRQAGKTTLARSLASEAGKPYIYLDLELDSDLSRLTFAELYLKEHQDKLVIIDEVQRRPELFPLLRALTDQHRVPGRFLILGSASPELLRQSSETLAGRISYLELTPFHAREIPGWDYRIHWLRGGFPPALLADEDGQAFQWLHDFSTAFIERDLAQFGLSAPSNLLRTLLQMLTGIHGSLLNYSTLANSLGISMPTVRRYLEYLDRAYCIRYLLPWHSNAGKRVVKTPKMFFRDSGMLHYFSGIRSREQLYGSHLLGASWEGYVIQQLLANLPAAWQPYFYRTKEGAELDLVLVQGTAPVLTVEVKYSDRPALSKGACTAISDLGAPLNLVLTPAGGNYPLGEQIRVCNLQEAWQYLS